MKFIDDGDRFLIGDLTLELRRFGRRDRYGFNRYDGHLSVRVCVFTDTLSLWRKLDKIGVFEAIAKAKLETNADLARLLETFGMKQDPPVPRGERAR